MAISEAQAPVQDNCKRGDRRGEREEARRGGPFVEYLLGPRSFYSSALVRFHISSTRSTVRDRLTRKLSIGGYITRAQMFIYLKAKQYPVFRLRAMITLIIVCLVQTR